MITIRDILRTSRMCFLLCPMLLLMGMITTSCKNDIDYIKSLSEQLNLPKQTGKNFEVQYTDSCRLQVIFKAPLVEQYFKGGEEGSYYEFTKGIEIHFFDRNEQLESIVTARYAKYWEEKQLGLARDSVVGRNVRTGEQLNTEELYWNRGKQIIYSGVFTKITNEDGVYYGERGFEADEGFQSYKLLGSSGTVRVKDEEIE